MLTRKVLGADDFEQEIYEMDSTADLKGLCDELLLAYKKAMALLDDVEEAHADMEPILDFHKRYYELTGDHMVLTEEGWMPPEENTREITGEDPLEVLDEVNRP